MESLLQIPYDIVLIVFALVFSVIWYVKLLKQPGRSPPLPPGPPGLPIVGNLPFLKPDLHLYFKDLARKYGPVFKLRLGSKLAVVITSHEVMSEIVKTHDVTFSNHDVTALSLIAMYGGKDVVWTPYGPEWRMLRKVCVHKMLSPIVVDSYYGLRRREVRQTVSYLAGRARAGTPVDVGEQLFVTLLNIMTQMLWGATVIGEDRDKTAAEFKDLVSEIVGLIALPNVSDFFPSLSRFDLQGLAKKMRGLALKLDQLLDQIIDQRLAMDAQSSKGDAGDFLQFLLKLKDEDETTPPLTMTHVKTLLLDMMIGGTDTCSKTTEFAMAELITKPETLKRAQQELEEVVGKDNIVEESHADKLPYLLAVMKETLRLHPVVPLLIPRRPSETTVVAGYTIPKDTMMFFNMWVVQRDPNFWEDASEFNPERFLNRFYDFKGSDSSYLPFGFGRRICAGIAMAEKFVLYNLATLLHSFDWKIPEGKRFVIEDKFEMGMRMKNPLVAIPIPRLSNPDLYLSSLLFRHGESIPDPIRRRFDCHHSDPNWYFKPKRPAITPPFPPGPPGLPIVRNLPFLKPDLHIYFEDLARKYGPILKLQLGVKLAVVVTSPEVLSEIIKAHDVAFANHDITAMAFIPTYGGRDIIWNTYGPEWRMLRKVCVNKLLSNTALDSYYGLRRHEIRRTVSYLVGRGREGLPVNLGEQIFLTILNIMTQILWGSTVASQEREKIAAEFKELVNKIVSLLVRPNISDFFPGLSRFDLQGLAKQMRGLVIQLDQLFDRIIDQRVGIEGEDFLHFLLKSKDEGETTPLSVSHVKALLMDMVLASTETSSSTIEFAMAELISNPETMKRVQQELDEVVGKDNTVEESHIPKLPYLLAVMKETLRLHPAGPFLVPRRTSETTIVAGYTIPKDSTVFFNVWAIHRNPSLWEKPLEFNPDRFINKAYDFQGNDTSYFPFGFGRRICAGLAMGERYVLYNLATLLHSFDWKVPEGKRVEIEEEFGMALRLKNPVVAIPVPRLSSPDLYL